MSKKKENWLFTVHMNFVKTIITNDVNVLGENKNIK